METDPATGLDDETGGWPATEPATAPDFVLPVVEPDDKAAAARAAFRLDDGWAAAGGAARPRAARSVSRSARRGIPGGGRGGGNGPAHFLGRRRLVHPLLDLLHG